MVGAIMQLIVLWCALLGCARISRGSLGSLAHLGILFARRRLEMGGGGGGGWRDKDDDAAPPGLAEPVEALWQYPDQFGRVQGPFPSSKMLRWYAHKRAQTFRHFHRRPRSVLPCPLIDFAS